MPAIARNSVDLPEPDGPVTSTGSPRGILTLSDATSGAPVGRFTATLSSSTARPSPVASTSITGGVCAAARAACHRQAEIHPGAG